MKIVTSWDDGNILDLRLAKLLRKYNLPAIFYLPINAPVIEKGQIQELMDFEIGCHTIDHCVLTRVDLYEADKQITECKRMMEDLINKPVTSFCYPRGYFNPEIKELVEKAGFLEARTTKVLYTNYADSFEKQQAFIFIKEWNI